MASLKGKTALVTGGTRGIGFAIAETLRNKGAHVIATGTSLDGVVPSNCTHIAVDFSNDNETKSFAKTILDLSVDILINNAGININAPFDSIEPDDYLKIQKINLTAPFLICKAVLPYMRAKKWGRIVNISSIWSKVSKENRGDQ